MAKTPRISRRRHIRKANFDRVRRDERTLDFWTTEGARLAASATSDDFTAATANDRCTAIGHGFSSGEGPFLVSSTTTLPGGLDAATLYYVTVISDDQFLLHAGSPGGGQVDILTTGTGTHSIVKAATAEAICETQRKNRPRSIAAATDIDALA